MPDQVRGIHDERCPGADQRRIGDCSRGAESTGAGVVLGEPDPACAVEAVRLRAEDAHTRRVRIASAVDRSRERIADGSRLLHRCVAEA